MATKAVNGKNANPTPADLSDQIETLRNDLTGLTEIITEMGKAKVADVADSAKSKAADLRGRAAAQAEVAKDQAAELQSQAHDFIRNQPATALGIAAGIGFLIGFMGSRK